VGPLDFATNTNERKTHGLPQRRRSVKWFYWLIYQVSSLSSVFAKADEHVASRLAL